MLRTHGSRMGCSGARTVAVLGTIGASLLALGLPATASADPATTDPQGATPMTVVMSPRAQSVYGDGVAQFTYDVSNTGARDLSAVNVADDHCAAVSGPSGGRHRPDGERAPRLAPGATWRFTCSVPAAELFAVGGMPQTSTVTVTARDSSGAMLSARDSAVTSLLTAGLALTASGPPAATVGELINYTLTVANTGNTSFPAVSLALSVSAAHGGSCDVPPATPARRGGDASPDQLDPAETWTYHCQVATARGMSRLAIAADVHGTDTGGRAVTVAASAETPLDAAGGAVSPASKAGGPARLAGDAGCVAGRYATFAVSGAGIRKVSFSVDGRRVRTLAGPGRGGLFRVRVRTRGLRYGPHRVVASIRFAGEARPRRRTLTLRFSRCRPRAAAPKSAR